MKNYSNLNIKQKKVFWKENPLHGEVEIKIQGIENFKMYNENDDTVVKELYWTNFIGWEYTSLVLWNHLLKLNKSGVIYDIGSYTGIYSLIAAKHSRENKIFAFDIQTNTLDRLKKNISINGMDNVRLVNAACTSFDGETTFSYCKEDSIISSVASLIEKPVNIFKKNITAIRLDSFDHKNNTAKKTVKLIKIDVEDAELDTLLGMKEILNRDKPDVLLEVNDSKKLSKVKKLFPNNYNVYDIREDSFLIKKIRWYSKPSKDRNYLFTTKKKNILRTLLSRRIN